MDPVLIPIVALLVPIIIVPTALGFRHARFLCEVAHKERIKAMELGRELPGDRSGSPAAFAAAIGAGVPILAMLFAWLASPQVYRSHSEQIWDWAALVGLAGLISGSILAARLALRSKAAATDQGSLKPDYDPDAYDVVGRRG